MIVAAFPEILLGSASFVFRDYGLFGYPLAHYNRECFWRGEIPLWNPLNNCGIPYLAQWNTMVLYPLSLIYLLFPLPWSLGVFCLSHLFLGGMGMFFLARRWTGQPLAAAVAGVAFAFNGLSLSCLIWPNNVAALGWMPWVILLVERSWREGGRTLLLAGWCGAIQMLAGAPEIFLFTWIILGGLWLAQLSNFGFMRGRLLLRTATVPILLIGLVSVQLFPFLDLLRQSHRDSNYGGSDWSMPPWGWANFLLPLFRCEPTSVGVYLQPGQGWVSSYYLGIFVFALALLAPWHVRKSQVWVLAALLGISLLMSLGDAGHLYPVLHRLFPPLGFVRFPIKWVVPAAFIVPLLAAVIIAYFISNGREGRLDTIKRTSFLCITAATTLIAFLLWFEHAYPNQPDSDWPSAFKNGLVRVALLGLLFICLNCLVRQPLRTIFSLVLLTGVWLDAITQAPRQNPSVNPSAYTLELDSVRQMKPRPRHGDSRAMLSLGAIEKFHSTIVSNTFDFMLGMRMGLYDNVNLLEGVPKVDGFYSLYLPYEMEVRHRLFASTNTVRGPLSDLLNVSHITAPNSYFDWESRPNWMPLITGGQKPEFADSEHTLESLMARDFDGRKTLYLPVSTPLLVDVGGNTRVRILPKHVSSHRLNFEVQADAAALVLVSQTYYPNWHAIVDGKQVPLWRADHSLQALQVPKGNHQVSLIYKDQAFLCGTLVSLIAAAASICAWFLLSPFGYERKGFPETSVHF